MVISVLGEKRSGDNTALKSKPSQYHLAPRTSTAYHAEELSAHFQASRVRPWSSEFDLLHITTKTCS